MSVELFDVIKKIQEMNDRLKYYNDNQFTVETMEAMVRDLSEIEDGLHDDCIPIEDHISDDTMTEKLEDARKLFISQILENPKLKKRQDMIDATENLDL